MSYPEGGMVVDTAEARLFPLPRIKADLTSPDVIRLAFTGVVELDRENADVVEYFNALKPGKLATICITARIDGGSKIYKLDDDEIAEVFETKRIVATEVYIGGVD